MASQGPQRPRRNASPASSSKPQPMRATLPFSLLRNPSPTRANTIRKPSPSSSPVHGVENGFKARRSSPETRASPEHRRSPTSPSSLTSKAGRPKELKSSSVAGIRRTSSLDAISGNYLSCQWPRDVGSYGPSVCHKSTQTPASWDDVFESEESWRVRHKRSNSWGSADHLKEKLKQNLQRTKQGSKVTQAHGRLSPLHGDHSAIIHTQSRAAQSSAIPIPVIPRPSEGGHQRRSVEGLNTEIERLVLTKVGEDSHLDRVSGFLHLPVGGDQFLWNPCVLLSEQVMSVADGRRAPVSEILSCNQSNFRTVDTQTPAESCDYQDGSGSSGNSSSRSHSVSPTSPLIPCATEFSTSRSSSGGVAEGEMNTSPELPVGPKYASSPRPNNSYLFAREPPDGAEKVPLHIEDSGLKLDPPQFSRPDTSKVKIIFSNTSPFTTLPSIPKVAVKATLSVVPPLGASLPATQ